MRAQILASSEISIRRNPRPGSRVSLSGYVYLGPVPPSSPVPRRPTAFQAPHGDFRPLSQTQVSVPVPWAKPPDPSSLPIYCPEKSGALKLRDTLARSSCYIARSLRLARVTRPALRAATSGGGRPSWRVRSAPIRRFASFSLEFHGEPCALRRPWSLWLGLVHARPADRMGDRGLDSPGGSGN